jgi:sugar phosphate isomerase/epimerase
MLAFSSALASFASLNAALASVRCPWFGIDLDPIAILRDEWDRHAIFSAVGPLIRHVRARDGARGAEKRIKPAAIGRGDVGWEQLLSLLDEAGYQGFITLDPMEMADRVGAVKSGITYLGNLNR